MTVLEADGLTKRYGDVVALDGLDLRAESGELLAVLGRNGAGKTTFVNLLATLLRPDDGTLRVHGVDVAERPAEARRMIGLAGQQATVEPLLTGRENLELVAALYGLRRRQARAAAAGLLDAWDLAEVADRLVSTYSGGLRRRLDLGASLIGRPRLVLLDEPTTGLDPASRRQLWDRIRRLVAEGTDVLLTTQYLEEADALADRVVVLDRGRIIADDSPAALKRQHGGSLEEVFLELTKENVA
jgi:ABC-2 type transport system ATP-binding protein